MKISFTHLSLVFFLLGLVTESAVAQDRFADLKPTGRFSDVDIAECISSCFQQLGDASYSKDIIVYTGDNTEHPLVVEAKIGDVQQSSWVQRQADPENCISSNKNDCMVWCLEEKPGLNNAISYLTVLDTTTVSEYKVYRFYGRTYQDEVQCYEVCEHLRTPFLFYQLGFALSERDYMQATDVEDRETDLLMKAILQFQRDNAIPYGQLTFETIKKLGINEY